MRLRSLDLLRYGHFTGVSVTLPERSPDFHMIFGPNEAGKSTTTTAIEDLLFGIPGNSTRNFLHDYAALRIGATLDADGRTLSFRRRKGNKDTLLTSGDTPLPAGDGALAPFLGGADRSFFARMFCLDHDRLRKGGRDILDARDDVGQMLFAAGTGVSGLRDHLTRLQEEADGLWAPRRAGHRRYYQAEDRLKGAETALRDHTVTSAKWQETKTAHEEAKAACEALERDIETLVAEQRKLTRIRRVHRDVRRCVEVDAALADMSGVVALPDDASTIVEKAAASDAAAATRISTLQEQAASVRDSLGGLTVDDALLQREADIALLHERRIQMRASKTDLPKRRAELAAAEASLRRIATELEWTDESIDALIARIPGRVKVTAVRALLTRRGGALGAVTSAQSAMVEAEMRATHLARQLADAPPPRDVSALAALIRATRLQGDLGALITAAARELADAQAQCGRTLSALAPTVANEEQLAALSPPAAETIGAHRDARRDLERRLEACDDRLRTVREAIERGRKAYARIVADERIIPADELADLRQRRDAGWSIIRRLHLDNASVAQDEMRAFTGESGLAAAYEAAVAAADDAADRRFDKAEATARAMVLSRQIADQQQSLEALEAERAAILTKQDALARDWNALWADTAISPRPPDEMLAWLTGRQQALDLIEKRDAIQCRLASLRDAEQAARLQFLAQYAALGAMTAPLGDLPLAALLESAADVTRQEEKRAQDRRDLEEAQRKADTEAESKRESLKTAQDAWSRWTDQWITASAALGLSSTSAPEVAENHANAIEEMRDHAARINDLRQERIGKIERDIAAFDADVQLLVAAVAPQLSGSAPEEAALALESLLREAVSIRDAEAQQNQDLTELDEKIDACERSRRDAQDIIGQFQSLAHTDSLDALRRAIKQSEQLRLLQAERREISARLAQDGDGLTLDDLAAECAGADLDGVSAREQTIERQLGELRERLMEASETRADARRDFEAIGGADQAAKDAADREFALAEMGEIAAQYVRVRSASMLLQWSIERFRREKQGPLLTRAGELFSILTGGSFDTLRLDYGEDDKAYLTGIRPGAEPVKVPGLSTGTADQLYLALRIAAVEEYLAHGTPLPFVADDLFVNYDDERAAAGFKVLARLAQKTQVLFLTHHHHLIEVAQQALGAELSTVTLDSRRTGASVAA